jgi:hypothetical protein
MCCHREQSKTSMEERVHKKSVKSDSQTPKYKADTSPNDVILGRGSFIAKFPGNIVFRQLLQERRQQYTSTCRRHLKQKIARQLILQVQERNGNFLRAVKSSRVDDEQNKDDKQKRTATKKWMIVDDASVSKIIKQALRGTHCHLDNDKDEMKRTDQEPSQDDSSEQSVGTIALQSDISPVPVNSQLHLSPHDMMTKHPPVLGDKHNARSLHRFSDRTSEDVEAGLSDFVARTSATNTHLAAQISDHLSYVPSPTASMYQHSFGFNRNQSLSNVQAEILRLLHLPSTSIHERVGGQDAVRRNRSFHPTREQLYTHSINPIEARISIPPIDMARSNNARYLTIGEVARLLPIFIFKQAPESSTSGNNLIIQNRDNSHIPLAASSMNPIEALHSTPSVELVQSINATPLNAGETAGISANYLSTQDLESISSENSSRIRNNDKVRGPLSRCDDRNALLHEHQHLHSSSMFQSNSLQPHLVERLQGYWTDVPSINNCNTDQEDNESCSHSVVTNSRLSMSLENKQGNYRTMQNSARSTCNADEDAESNPGREDQKKQWTTANQRKRKSSWCDN